MSPKTSAQISSPSLAIAIPASFIDIYADLAQRTIQIGRIARAAAIFRVSKILVYPDRSPRKQARQRRLITRVLEYMETPQYLRKHIFGKLPELRFVGLLPPLRTPHHPVEKHARALSNGEIREGFAFPKKGRLVVDVGVEQPLPLRKPLPPRTSGRVTVRISRTSKGILEAVLAPPLSLPEYWGYQVIDTQRQLGAFLHRNSSYDLIIATSRKGTPINNVWKTLHNRWYHATHILVLFGSHAEGLTEILQREEKQLPSIADFVVNTALNQGVSTIRTEEAIFLSLAVLRLLDNLL